MTRSERDRGAILVMTLVLTLILGVVACALAAYAATGLRTSKVTDTRTERVGLADAGLRIGVELLKQDPSACSRDLSIGDAVVQITCVAVTDTSRVGPYRITARVQGGSLVGTADVQAYTSSGKPCGTTAERCTVMVNSWSVS